MTERKCENCEFWGKKKGRLTFGTCKKHIPLPWPFGWIVRPMVHWRDWCGEFKEESNED